MIEGSPTRFEPLFPSEASVNSVLGLAHELVQDAVRLDAQLPAGASRSVLTALLREMNSYYTNRIEGQHTFPMDIQRALAGDYSQDSDRARRQRLALAHIHTENWAEQTLADGGWRAVYAPEILQALHRHLYEQLPPEDRAIPEGEIVEPGAWRAHDVQVGTHVAPPASSVPVFLERWQEAYARLPDGERAVIGVACAHHRLTWVHPFLDGNGRVARLHSHLLFYRMGLLNGLWSPMRGLARTRERYYECLSGADAQRSGDLDGRGNLSEAGLLNFVRYFLEICLDQVRFMRRLLEFTGMRERMRELLTVESMKAGSHLRPEAAHALHYLFLVGILTRGEFKAMTGLPKRTAERVLAELLRRDLLCSDSPKGPVRIGIPLWALRYYFPNLWTEAENDTSSTNMPRA
ncbi:MAG: Fic family protein [Acidithiobacillus sp.]